MVAGIAPDGSPVELYERWLPPRGEAELVHDVTRDGGVVLELGCGAGRITRGLVALGHPVVAVDASSEMLSRVLGLAHVETVCARIEDLNLGRRFDAVVLASNLVNTADDGQRAAILQAASCHVDTDGSVLIERMDPRWADPAWAADKAAAPGFVGEVRVATRKLKVTPPFLSHATEYRAPDGTTWVQGPYRLRSWTTSSSRTNCRPSGFALNDGFPGRELIGSGAPLDLTN